jgi:hypothetical protein
VPGQADQRRPDVAEGPVRAEERASAISTGQAPKYPGVTKAETSSGPAGSCSRLAAFVLAQAISRAWASGSSAV